MKNKLIVCLSVFLMTLSNGLYAGENLSDTPREAYDKIIKCMGRDEYSLCKGKSNYKITKLIKNEISDRNGKLKKGYEVIFTYWDDRIGEGYSNLLTKAIEMGNKKLLELFMAFDPGIKVNINGRQDEIIKPLHTALQAGYTDIARLLILKGADVNIRGHKNITPLHTASKSYKDIVQLLISNGAEVNAVNKYGETPLHWAANVGTPEIARLLISKRAKIDAVTKKGKTALAIAALDADKDMVYILLYSGADPSIGNILKDVTEKIEYSKHLADEHKEFPKERERYENKIKDYIYIRILIEHMLNPQNQLYRMKNYWAILEEKNKINEARVLKTKINRLIKKLELENSENNIQTSLITTLDKLNAKIPFIKNIFGNMS